MRHAALLGIELAGVALVVAGCWLAWPPAAWIVAGVAAVWAIEVRGS